MPPPPLPAALPATHRSTPASASRPQVRGGRAASRQRSGRRATRRPRALAAGAGAGSGRNRWRGRACPSCRRHLRAPRLVRCHVAPSLLLLQHVALGGIALMHNFVHRCNAMPTRAASVLLHVLPIDHTSPVHVRTCRPPLARLVGRQLSPPRWPRRGRRVQLEAAQLARQDADGGRAGRTNRGACRGRRPACRCREGRGRLRSRPRSRCWGCRDAAQQRAANSGRAGRAEPAAAGASRA